MIEFMAIFWRCYNYWVCFTSCSFSKSFTFAKNIWKLFSSRRDCRIGTHPRDIVCASLCSHFGTLEGFILIWAKIISDKCKQNWSNNLLEWTYCIFGCALSSQIKSNFQVKLAMPLQRVHSKSMSLA